MAFVVEDGTGKTDANALASVAFVQDYAAETGRTFATSPELPAQQAIVRATAYIVGEFRGQWRGSPVNGRSQRMPWPRIGALDDDGDDIPEDEIPLEVQQAVAEAAIREIASPGSLAPDVSTSGDQVKRVRKKLGPLETETEFFVSTNTAPEIPVIAALIAPLIDEALDDGDGARVAFLRRA